MSPKKVPGDEGDIEDPPTTPTSPTHDTGNQPTVPAINAPFIVPKQVPSTPASIGTAMSAQSSDGLVGRELAGWIAEDLKPETRTYVLVRQLLSYFVESVAKKSTTLDADTLLQTIIKYTTEVYKSPEFARGREYLAQYRGALSKEFEGYEPLAKCLNEAFGALAKKQMPELRGCTPQLGDLYVHVNGDREITHKYPLKTDRPMSLRPDLCIINKNLHTALEAKAKGDKVKLEWRQNMAAMELKRSLGVDLSAIHGTNEGPQSLDQIPEYYVLPDGPWSSTTGSGPCASKRYMVTESAPDAAFGRPRNTQPHLHVSSVSSMSSAGGSPHKKLPPNLQLGLYGMEMLNRGVYTLQSMNFLVVDDLVWIWINDRQNVVQSTGLNFVENMPYFMVMLAVMQRFELEDWGVAVPLVPKDMFIKPDALKNCKVDVTFGDTDQYMARITHPEPEDLRVRGPVMKGRATCLLDATFFERLKGDQHYTQLTNRSKQFVVKASWPEAQRLNEVAIIHSAQTRLQHKFDNHLPEFVTSRKFGYTGKLDEALKKFGAKREAKTFPRNFYFIIFGRLEPLITITNQDIFMKVWVECLICHYELWQKGIQHGDISVWNLMFRRVSTSNGEPDEWKGYGVVNDFDLSVIIDDKGNSQHRGGQRTGTLPFMARDTLKPKFMRGGPSAVRRYIHEFECFVWVLSWLCLREYPKDPVDGDPKDLEDLEWRTGTYKDILIGKMTFVTSFQDIKDSNIRYPNAWNKCKMLLEILKQRDNYEGALAAYGHTSEFLDEVTYNEAVEIARSNTYTNVELEAFNTKTREMVRSK